MRIEDLWQELKKEVVPGAADGWISRFAVPDPGNKLLVAVNTMTRKLALLLPSAGTLPPRSTWPHCLGLELFTAQVDGSPHFGVRLQDESYRDVFSALAEDVAPRLIIGSSERSSENILLDRLRRWQKFLTARKQGLSISRQRGLFGELHTIRHVLGPTVGMESTITGWRAPHASHQDFQFAGAAIEVKTTTAKQPQDVRITSERQLDETGSPALFLLVCVLDEREVEPENASQGETLPESVNAVRQVLGSGSVIRETFDDRLLDAGYLDADAPHFETRRFTLRAIECFRVTDTFPRLIEKDLPTGVGDVSYALSLAACAPYAVPSADILTAVNAAPGRKQV
jgi:hypothetical protein